MVVFRLYVELPPPNEILDLFTSNGSAEKTKKRRNVGLSN